MMMFRFAQALVLIVAIAWAMELTSSYRAKRRETKELR